MAKFDLKVFVSQKGDAVLYREIHAGTAVSGLARVGTKWAVTKHNQSFLKA